MTNLGWSKKKALAVEANYHELYKVADKWVQDRLLEASKVGYATVAFGLRVRTPILHQTILGKRSTPSVAEAEGRSVGNAMGQSYGMLNNRAAIEFQQRVLDSEYWNDIYPIMQIHDSIYGIVRNKVEVVKWVNDNLPECMAWQDLPELEHDKVKLSGGVELFYPNWATKTSLPNGASEQEIIKLCK